MPSALTPASSTHGNPQAINNPTGTTYPNCTTLTGNYTCKDADIDGSGNILTQADAWIAVCLRVTDVCHAGKIWFCKGSCTNHGCTTPQIPSTIVSGIQGIENTADSIYETLNSVFKGVLNVPEVATTLGTTIQTVESDIAAGVNYATTDVTNALGVLATHLGNLLTTAQASLPAVNMDQAWLTKLQAALGIGGTITAPPATVVTPPGSTVYPPSGQADGDYQYQLPYLDNNGVANGPGTPTTPNWDYLDVVVLAGGGGGNGAVIPGLVTGVGGSAGQWKTLTLHRASSTATPIAPGAGGAPSDFGVGTDSPSGPINVTDTINKYPLHVGKGGPGGPAETSGTHGDASYFQYISVATGMVQVTATAGQAGASSGGVVGQGPGSITYNGQLYAGGGNVTGGGGAGLTQAAMGAVPGGGGAGGAGLTYYVGGGGAFGAIWFNPYLVSSPPWK